jgi:hypothetical protein
MGAAVRSSFQAAHLSTRATENLTSIKKLRDVASECAYASNSELSQIFHDQPIKLLRVLDEHKMMAAF